MRGIRGLGIQGMLNPIFGISCSGESSLNSGLLGAYKLEETSGNRIDSTGRGNTLVPTGAIGYRDGIVGNGVDFVSSDARWLAIPNASAGDYKFADNSWTIAFWVSLDNSAVDHGFVSMYESTGNQRSYALGYSAGENKFYVNISADGINVPFFRLTNFGTPATGTNYCVVLWYDPDANEIYGSINKAPANYVTHAGGVFNTTANFKVGADRTLYHDGMLDELYIWSRILTSFERLEFYNYGAGKTYPFRSTGLNWFPFSTDVTTAKSDIISALFLGNGMPANGADSIETGVADVLSTSPTNLLRVDKLHVNIYDYSSNLLWASEPYVWYPAVVDSNGILAIVSYGHANPPYTWEPDSGYADMIRALVEAGFTTVACHYPPMPHNSWMKKFVEGQIRVINELLPAHSAVYMVGKSGGAVPTTLVAAIDDRVTRSVEVAGTYPLFITEASRDWEQFLPGIYDVYGYDFTDLYMMGCTGGRKQLAIHNTVDIFGVAPYVAQGQDFAEFLPTYAERLGGEWSFFWDQQNTHIISAVARAKILKYFS